MGKGPRCHTPWGGLGMNMGTITVEVVLSYRSVAGEPSAPAACRRLEDGGDCHDGADNSDEGGGAQPGGHGRSRVHLACRAGGLGLGYLQGLGHRSQVDDGNCYGQAEMLACHDRSQDRDNNLPGKQRPPARTLASHWEASRWLAGLL